MSQKNTPLFEKISISEAILGLLCAVMGLVLIFDYMFDDHLPWVLYVLNAAVLFSTGVYRIRWAFYRRKETINGNYFCYPTSRGLYAKITNEVFYLFPIMNTLIMAFHRITDIVTLIMLVGISVFLAIWTSYGVKYSRSKLLVIQNDGVMLLNYKKENFIRFEDIYFYRNSIRIGGYKAVGFDGNILFEWAWAWDNSDRLVKELREKNVTYKRKDNISP